MMRKIRFIILAVFLTSLFLLADWPDGNLISGITKVSRVDTMSSSDIAANFSGSFKQEAITIAATYYENNIYDTYGNRFLNVSLKHLRCDSAYIDSFKWDLRQYNINAADDTLIAIWEILKQDDTDWHKLNILQADTTMYVNGVAAFFTSPTITVDSIPLRTFVGSPEFSICLHDGVKVGDWNFYVMRLIIYYKEYFF